jgi:hypothetical protein
VLNSDDERLNNRFVKVFSKKMMKSKAIFDKEDELMQKKRKQCKIGS